ncbi:MAG: DUF4290 domain-containing protein [Bacteroidales bacterium]|jgi:hypothetical protein|nr:DUF4290 domain-containing protein [Bacteroidales bacterium]
MDYNTQRKKLLMPEYGRNVQRMIEQVMQIPDKEKRNEQIRAVVSVMGILNPQLRDLSDFKHKLWDHVQIISDFQLDIDSPYPLPTREVLQRKPQPLPLQNEPLKEMHYGRNIQNMITAIAAQEDGEEKTAKVRSLAHYMRQQYLIWNKDTVSDELIFRDIVRMSDGKIQIPEDLRLNQISDKETFNKPTLMLNTGEAVAKKNNQNNRNKKGNQQNNKSAKNNKKRWKPNK